MLPQETDRPPSWGVFTLLLHYYSMMIDEDGAGGGRQGGTYVAVYYSFSSFSRPETGSGFWSSARLPGPPPPRIMKWQTGPLYNRSGVEPVRLHTVYAFNRPRLPAGLEPGYPPLYLADKTFLHLHTVLPLRADKHVGSPVWSTTFRLVKQHP